MESYSKKAAGLLCLISLALALPLQQISIDSRSTLDDLRDQHDAQSKTEAYSIGTLTKRSPMQNASSSAAFSRYAGHKVTIKDLHDYRASIDKYITYPEEYLNLMDKAVYSGSVGIIPYHADEPWILRGKAIKWLERAEASILRTPEMIQENQKYYDDKVEGLRRDKEKERAYMKGQSWKLLKHHPKITMLHGLIEHPERSYQELMEVLRSRLAEQIENGASEADVAITNEELKEASDAYDTWLTSTDPQAAMMMVNKELNRYAKVSQQFMRCKTANLQDQMIDYAMKATAWNRKARDLEAA